MGINIGTSTTSADEVYVGTESIGEIYVGTELVWQKTSGIPPTSLSIQITNPVVANPFGSTQNADAILTTTPVTFTATVADDDPTNGTYEWFIGDPGISQEVNTHPTNTFVYTNGFTTLSGFFLTVRIECVFTDNTGQSITSNGLLQRFVSP